MSIVRTAIVGMSILSLGVGGAWAADSSAAANATAPAGKTAPTPAKPDAAAAKGGALPIKDSMVGSWKSVDDGEVMELAADGNARVKDPNATFTATYKLLDDGSMHLEVPIFGKQKDFFYKIELKGDELTLTMKDRKPRTYVRVK